MRLEQLPKGTAFHHAGPHGDTWTTEATVTTQRRRKLVTRPDGTQWPSTNLHDVESVPVVLVRDPQGHGWAMDASTEVTPVEQKEVA